MIGIPAPGPSSPHGLLGVLRAWLKGQPGAAWQASEALPEALPFENTEISTHFYGAVRVLVVDDNPVNLMLISVLLESRGLVPMLAADGAEAVALACEMPFDLILMDLQMPILDGFGATTAIRRFENQRSRPAVPVVAFSSSPAGAHVLAARGMNGSLPKPCTDEELEGCLTQWCPSYRSAPAERELGVPRRRAGFARAAQSQPATQANA